VEEANQRMIAELESAHIANTDKLFRDLEEVDRDNNAEETI